MCSPIWEGSLGAGKIGKARSRQAEPQRLASALGANPWCDRRRDVRRDKPGASASWFAPKAGGDLVGTDDDRVT
jgi:hypothetical protein